MAETTYKHPEETRFRAAFDQETKRLAESGKVFGPNDSGYNALQTNIAYYSKGGEGYNIGYKDYQLQQSQLKAKELGITPAQLVENPNLATDPEALAKYTGGTYNGTSYAPGSTAWAAMQAPQAPIPGAANQPPPLPDPNAISKKYEEAFNDAKASGVTSPTDYTGASSMYKTFIPDQPSQAGDFVSQDPYLNTVMKGYQDYMSQENQRTSLVQEYQNLLKSSGIEGIDAELINMKKVIEGSEDDLRTEITKAGGFATDSQVMALTNARNKQLIKNYNTLLDTRSSKESYLNNMMNLTAQDRQAADKRFEMMTNFGLKMVEINQTMKKNAIDTIDRVAKTMGWDGVYQSTGGNAQLISQIERTYGMPQGSLAIAAQRDYDKRIADEQEKAWNVQYKALQSEKLSQDIDFATEDRPLDTQEKQLGIQEKKLGLSLKAEQIKTEQAQRANIYSQIAEKNKKPIEEQVKQDKLVQSQVSKASTVLQKAKEASSLISGFSTGLAAMTGFIPGTPAKNLQGKIDTIKANLGFDALQEMRNNSPTGGALGSIAVQELEMLQSTVASLDTGQKPSQLRQSLTDVQTHYINWLATVGYSVAPTGDIIQIK